MLAFKKKYFLIIESIKDLDLKKIKKRNKFIIIYRNRGKREEIFNLISFRKKCKIKNILFYVANDLNLAVKLHSDGIYLSSFNKSFKSLNLKRIKFNIIGGAHDTKEIHLKISLCFCGYSSKKSTWFCIISKRFNSSSIYNYIRYA